MPLSEMGGRCQKKQNGKSGGYCDTTRCRQAAKRVDRRRREEPSRKRKHHFSSVHSFKVRPSNE